MVSLQTSSGVNEALGTSLDFLLMQYLQSKMHSLVNNILSNETHLPSAEKVWQIPHAREFPIPLPLPLRSTPLEVQATSYFAASVSMASFFIRDIFCWMFMLIFISILKFFVKNMIVSYDPVFASNITKHVLQNKWWFVYEINLPLKWCVVGLWAASCAKRE